MIKLFKANAIILFSHMFIIRAARLKDYYTHLINVRPTASIRHMITALRLYYQCLAFKTIFNV